MTYYFGESMTSTISLFLSKTIFAHERKKSSSDETILKIFQNIIDFSQNTIYFRKKETIAQDLSALSPKQFHQLITKLCKNLASNKDPIKTLQRLLEIIPIQALEKAIRIDHPSHINALQTSKDMLQKSKRVLEKTTYKMRSSLHTKMTMVMDSLISIIENILTVSGVNQIFRPSENDLDADMKGQRLMGLVTLMSLLSTSLIPLLGASFTSMFVGGLLLFLIILCLIYPIVRPAPFFLPSAKNWSSLFEQGKLFVADGRKKALDEIARTLIGNKTVKTHPMLIGKTGVGKTETIKSLVQAISRGDYPELKGKRVFYINTADLVNYKESFGNGGSKILSKISNLMGRHRDKFILVFDEIHLACQKNEQSAIGEQLKTLLDPGNESFPYVIGITTEEEFYRDIYVNHSAFARRFKRINIESTTPSETLEILQNSLLQRAPKTIVENGALQFLMKSTHTLTEPTSSLKILTTCIQKTAESQKSPLEITADQIRSHIQELLSSSSTSSGTDFLPYTRKEKLTKLETELQAIDKKIKEKKVEYSRLSQARDTLWDIKRLIYGKVLKTAPLSTENISSSNQKELKSVLFLSHFLAPAMESFVREESNRLGIKTVIDKPLIQSILKEEKENNKKVQAAILHGKTQIRERSA